MKDLFSGINSKLSLPPHITNTPSTNTYLEEMKRGVMEKQHKEEKYKTDVLETLRRIERNTADLQSVVSLLQTSNKNQESIFEIVVEILSISKANSPEEADNMYRSVMDNVQTLNDDVETAGKLLNLANMVWTMAKEYFKNPQ